MTSSSSSNFQGTFISVILFISLFATYVLLSEELVTKQLNKLLSPVNQKPKTLSLDPHYYVNQLESSLGALDRRLEVEYGDYKDELFSKKTIEKLFDASAVGRERLARRLKVKFLKNVFSGGRERLVWATGGHSAAAGHGNLMNQTYTSYLKDTLAPVTASLGLGLNARNGAIGGMPSGPELAMCQSEIYGPDVDFLMWDFAMTEVYGEHRINYWANRAGLMLHRAILFEFEGYNLASEREDMLREWENYGMAIFQLKSDQAAKMLVKAVPDALLETRELPMAVKALVCDGSLEHTSRSPCKEEKYDTKRYCGGRDVKWQAPWHPGWKSHMFYGRLFGLYIINLLKEVIHSFQPSGSGSDDNSVPTISQSYLDYLLQLEQEDEKLFLSSFDNPVNLPRTKDQHRPKTQSEDNIVQLEQYISQLLPKKSFCHSALLPNYMRYHYITVGNFSGHPVTEIDDISDPFPLVYADERQEVCDDNIPLNYDFKDYFYVKHGAASELTLPNDQELNWMHSHGHAEDYSTASVMVCLMTSSDFGNFNKEYMIAQNVTSESVAMTINGMKVVNYIFFEHTCILLENSDGIDWKYNDDKRLNMKFRVLEKDKSLFITSIIIFFS